MVLSNENCKSMCGYKGLLPISGSSSMRFKQHNEHDKLGELVSEQNLPFLYRGSMGPREFLHSIRISREQGSGTEEASPSTLRSERSGGRYYDRPPRKRLNFVLTSPHSREWKQNMNVEKCNPHSHDTLALPGVLSIGKHLSHFCNEFDHKLDMFVGNVNRCVSDLNRDPLYETHVTQMHKDVKDSLDKGADFCIDMHSYPVEMVGEYEHWNNFDVSIMSNDQDLTITNKLKKYLEYSVDGLKVQVVPSHPISYTQSLCRERKIPCLLIELNESTFFQDPTNEQTLLKKKLSKVTKSIVGFFRDIHYNMSNTIEEDSEDLQNSLDLYRQYLDSRPFVI